MLGEEAIRWDVVEEHLDEAEFLVEQWVAARRSPDYTLEGLRDGPERRLLAHVDGLVVNGPVALERLAWPALERGDQRSLVTAATLALLDGGDVRVLDAFLGPRPEDEPPEADAGPDAASASDDELPAEVEAPEPEPDPREEGMALALALSSHPQLDDQLRSRARTAEGVALARLLQACADRGLDAGVAIDRALELDDVALQRAALRAAVFSDRRRLLASVEARLRHPALAVRQAALDTGFCWGSRAAWEEALRAHQARGGGSAMVWLACLGDDRQAQELCTRLDDPALRDDALWALGFSGRVAAIEGCARWLDADDERTRKLAGEAIAAIVGLDPDDESLWETHAVEPRDAGIQGDDPDDDDDDLDADLTTAPVDDLPRPNPAAIRRWWEEHGVGFVAGQRYVLGRAVGPEGPGWALSQLSCRRVDVMARELVARSQGVGQWPGRALAPTHSRAARHLASLGGRAGPRDAPR